ncbi:MAG: MoxR family ATPase [Ardenticatenales bacterium]|nr:MoxR family ATPase [Ardenticatenales bacterium]
MTMTLHDLSDRWQVLRDQAAKVVVGQDDAFEQVIVAVVAGGHVLLEGVPGIGKTLLARTVAGLIDAPFRRVQFTPDLMPSDIIGTQVFDLTRGQFFLKKGPVFTSVLLADEINRAPAKTQAGLLEAMEERQVTIEGERHALPDPYIVIATQNPVEYEGTYPLPEAQLDRFLFKIVLPYPPAAVEREVLRRYHTGFDARNLAAAGLTPVLHPDDLPAVRAVVAAVTVEDGVLDYIGRITGATRESSDLLLGASPRASIGLLLASKAAAALAGRDYVTPDDVKRLAPAIYRHRIILRPEAEIDGLDADAVIGRLLDGIPVPR